MIRLKRRRGVGTSRAIVTESHDVENWIRCERVNEMTMAIVNGWNDIATFIPCISSFTRFVCIIFLFENRKKPISIDSFVLFIFSSKNFFPSFVCRHNASHTHKRGHYYSVICVVIILMIGFSRVFRIFVYLFCALKCGDIFCRIQRNFIAFTAQSTCWLHWGCFDRLVNSKIASNYLLINHCFGREKKSKLKNLNLNFKFRKLLQIDDSNRVFSVHQA